MFFMQMVPNILVLCTEGYLIIEVSQQLINKNNISIDTVFKPSYCKTEIDTERDKLL